MTNYKYSSSSNWIVTHNEPRILLIFTKGYTQFVKIREIRGLFFLKVAHTKKKELNLWYEPVKKAHTNNPTPTILKFV